MNTGVYDKQAKAVINKKLRDVDKRLSAYCMQVVSGGDADSLAGEFASDVGASIEDGETQVSVTASDMGHAMSEEARKKIHYSPDADLIATLSAASLQSYRSWEDRTSAGDVLKGFAAQTKDAVSLLPSGTNAERAARLAEYLKKPATIVADSEGSAVRPQKALFSNLRRLVVSDIATAYRVVEKRIWNALPFVVGYEVLLGDNHRKIDMCDDLQGIYPKDFDFFGWHPWCRCFARPIFSWESERVTEVPENFNTWIEDNKERIERARERGTLPRWIKDNPKYVDGVLNAPPQELTSRIALRGERWREYRRLLDDPNYRNVEFNENTLGIKAEHTGHNFDKKGGVYEKHVRDAGYKAGHVVILGNEYSTTIGERFTEGTWDGMKFEVAGRETATSNNILRGLKHCAEKRNTEIAILDFPNGGFSQETLSNAVNRYRGLEKLHDGQYVKFKKIICVQNREIVYEMDF